MYTFGCKNNFQMNIERVKIEPLIVVKDEIERLDVMFEHEEKPQNVEKFTSDENETLNSADNEDTSKSVETTLHICCYCGERRESKEMAQTPGTYKELLKWSQVLGKQIYNTFKTMSMVCRSHFNDEFGDSRLVDVVCGNVIVETKLGDRWKCCYCGKSRLSRFMTGVPNDKFYFDQWAKILGKRFYEYFQKRKQGFICRSHFDVEWQGKRPKDVLPVSDLNEDLDPVPDEVFTKPIFSVRKNTCSYCEESKSYDELTKLPQNPKTLKKWAEILGEDFYKRALSKKTMYICRDHFDVTWESIRPHTLLPRVNPVQLLANEEKPSKISIDNSSLDSQVKLGKSEVNFDSNWRDENQKIENQIKVEQDGMKQENFTNQEGPSDTKRIKIEIKEESVE